MLWLNGQLLDEDAARINPADRGFLLGDGVFETMLAIDGHVIDFDAHMDRLAEGLSALAISLPYSHAEIGQTCADLLARNALMTGRASLRFSISRGIGPRGLTIADAMTPTCLLTAAPAPAPPAAMTVITSQRIRNEHSLSSKYKTLNYLDNIIARHDADAAGADEALMRNTQGCVACASAANVWCLEDRTLLTPPLHDGALNGTVRCRLLTLAPTLGLHAEETSLSRERIAAADGVFLTNSLIGVTPVTRMDGQTFPISPYIQTLARAYAEHVQ